MKKILVTGASGFIGSHVVHELIARGFQVAATSRDITASAAKIGEGAVNYVQFDLSDFDPAINYYEFFGKPDILIHLAWEGLPNYKAAFHLEENLPRHFAFVKNLIHFGLTDLTVAGTCFEYGLQEGVLVETMESLPSNPYAVAKDQLRQLISGLEEAGSFSFKWVRFFYLYGPRQSPNSLLSQLQTALANGDEVFNMSPGDQLRDYLPVETAASIFVDIATQKKVTGIINCCSGEPVEVRALVEQYLLDHNASIRLNLGHYPYSDIEPRNFWGDTTKMKTITNHE